MVSDIPAPARFGPGSLILPVFLFLTLAAGAQEKQEFAARGETQEMRYNFALSEGLKYKMLGNPTEAAVFFKQCNELLPERPVPYYELAMIAFMEKKYPEAEALVQTAVGLDRQNKWYRFLAVQVLVAQERFSEAAKAYLSINQELEQNNDYVLAAVNLLTQAGQTKEALNWIKILKKDPDYRDEAMIREKEILLSQGKDKKAIAIMRELADENPDMIEYRGILAELLVEKGFDREAIEEYQKIKDSNPDNPIVYFSLGQYYYDKNRRKEAIREFQTGFRSKQVNPDIKYNLFLELASKNPEDSLNQDLVNLLDAMYEADHGHPGIDAIYADYQFNTGHMDEAEVVYKRVVNTNPGHFLAWQNLLFIQNDQLDFEEMYDYGKRACLVFPNQTLFFLFHGIACNALERYTEAVEVLKKGKRLNSGNAELTKQYYVSLGDALYHAGQAEEAFQNYELALVLDNQNPLVLNNYAYYLSVENKDLDKALTMIEKCISLEPDNATYLDTYAWVLFRRGSYEQALIHIEAAIKNDKDEISGEVMEHYGDILFMNQRTEEAIQAWMDAENLSGASSSIGLKIKYKSINGEK